MESSEVCTTDTDPEHRKYEKLHKFSFHDNIQFMEGWKKVKNIVLEDQRTDALIKAQTFFYSRVVEPVQSSSYKDWLEENALSVPHLDELVKQDEPVTIADDNTHKDHQPADGETTKDIHTIGQHPANFGELVHMIQNGITLADTDDLGIRPTNEHPTPGSIPRQRKPWETG